MMKHFTVIIILLLVVIAGFSFFAFLRQSYVSCLDGFCTQRIDLRFTENDDFVWSPAKSEQSEIRSVRLDGSIIGSGRVRIFLNDGGGRRFLVLDNSRIPKNIVRFDPTVGFVITGRIIFNKSNATIGEQNETVETVTPSLQIPINLTVDSPQNITYTSLSIRASVTTDIEADWCGYSIDKDQNVTLESEDRMNWTSDLLDLSIDQHEIVFYCSVGNGTASDSLFFSFLPEHTLFEDVCVETCDLEGESLNESEFNITVEVDEGTVVEIDNIDYNVELVVTKELYERFEKLQDDPDFDVVVDSSEIVDGNLVVVFHHTSSSLEPIRIEGRVNYDLSKTQAGKDEQVTLTVFNYQDEFFELVVGEDSERIGFGKKPIQFDRDLNCHKCGKHKAPPIVDVNMTITVTVTDPVGGTVVDFFENDWTVTDANGGTVTQLNSTHSQISWSVGTVTDQVTRSYLIHSPQRTTPATKYDFYTEFAGEGSGDWFVIVADPTVASNEFTDTCANLNNWTAGTGWAIKTGRCENKNSDSEANLTKLTPINLADSTILYATLTLDWETNSLESGEYLTVYANSTTNGAFVQINVTGGDSGGSVKTEYNLSAFITLDAGVHIRFGCNNDANNDQCLLDNINVTSYKDVNDPPLWNITTTGINDTEPIGINTAINHSANWSDDNSLLNTWLFEWNGSNSCDGVMTNASTGALLGGENISTSIQTIHVNCNGSTILWRFWVNDSAGNFNVTDNQTYLVESDISPMFSQASINHTSALLFTQDINHSVIWDDDSVSGALDSAIFEWNGSNSCDGIVTNHSTISLSGTHTISEFSFRTGEGCNGTTISWRVYANDSSGQMNVTTNQTYDIVDVSTIGLRPNANTTVQWDCFDGTLACGPVSSEASRTIDEIVSDPTAGDEGDWIEEQTINDIAIFNLSTIAVAGSETINATVVDVRIYTNVSVSGVAINVTLRYDDADQSTIQIVPTTSSDWEKVNFTGLSLTRAQVNSLEIKFDKKEASADIARVITMYANLTYIVTDDPPDNFNVKINETSPVDSDMNINHSTEWTDDIDLDSAILEWNGTSGCSGGITNESTQLLTPATASAEFLLIPGSGCGGKTVFWRIYANDTEGQFNVTPNQTYDVSAAAGQQLSNVTMTLPNTDLTNVTQETAFSMNCQYTFNGTGSVPNITVFWEFCDGDGCTPDENITAARNVSVGLFDTAKLNPVDNASHTVTHSIEGVIPGLYEVRCRGRDNTNTVSITSEGSITINISAPEVASEDDFNTLGGNTNRTGVAVSFVPDFGLYDSTGLTEELNITTSEFVQGTPIIDDNILYVLSETRVYAYWIANDTQNWNASISGPTYSTPTVSGDRICYGEKDNITCRYIANGTLLWTYNESGIKFDLNSPIIINDRLWIGSTRGGTGITPKVYSFWSDNGTSISNYTIPSQTSDAPQFATDPTVVEGRVYIGTVGFKGIRGFLLALNETNGTELLWNHTFASTEGGGVAPWYSAPSICEGNVLIGVEDADSTTTNPSYLLALNKNDGTQDWRANITEGGLFLERSVPVCYSDKAIVAVTDLSESTFLWAFNNSGSNGSFMWNSTNLGADVWASPAAADGKVVIGTSEGNVWVIDTQDGSTLWNLTTNNAIYSMPVIYNGKVFIADQDGKVNKYLSQTVHTNASTTLVSGKLSLVNATNESDVELEIYANATGTFTISIKKYVTNPAGANTFGNNQLNKFIDISDPDNAEANMSHTIIRLFYTDDEIKQLGLNESNLSMFFYNEATEDLEEESNTTVNTTANYVWANVTHFSIFGVGGPPNDGDSDGIPDKVDNCKAASNANQADGDGDGTGDVCDNCALISNGNQKDIDSDGIGDVCDSDIDGDGTVNLLDLCPLLTASQVDTDSDGVGDDCDNCRTVANAGQEDQDRDGQGNACDTDDDEDGMLDAVDNCPLLFSSSQLADTDGDGVGDSCDNCALTSNADQLDANNDGIGDACGVKEVAPSPTTSVGGGGGASGSGVIPIITPDRSGDLKITNPDLSITNINIDTDQNARNIRLNVFELLDLPEDVPPIDGLVFQYMDITYINLDESFVNQVVLSFKVDKSWINENNIDTSTIALNRFKNNQWVGLPTRFVSEDPEVLNFESDSPGLSIFAVTGSPAGFNIVWILVSASLVIALLIILYIYHKRKVTI